MKIMVKEARLSTDQFIKRAIKIHGDKYNYEKTEYRTSGDLIKIYCNIHKIEFEQLPFSHLNGCGCYLCARKDIKSTKDFIIRAKEYHGDRYRYPKNITKYTGNRDYIKIKCHVHGFFDQIACYHIAGNGCQKCGDEFQFISEESRLVFEEIQSKYKNLVTEDSEDSYDILKIEGWKGKFDAFLPEHKLFIEYDGSYWHKDRLENDLKKNLFAKKKGFQVLRIRQQPLDKIKYL